MFSKPAERNLIVHILYLYQYFVARKGHGMTRAYEFARRLIKAGHRVTVITLPGYLPEEYQSITRITRLEIEGVPAIIIPVAYSNHMGFRRRIVAFVSFAVQASWLCITEKADLIYASSGPLTIAFPAIAGKLWQRIPMVFEVRDLWPQMPIALGVIKDPISKFIARAMELIAYRFSDHIVALSPGMAQGIQARGIPAERISIIPNSSDVDLFDIPRQAGERIRQKVGVGKGEKLLVYTGSFAWMYNLSYLAHIAACARSLEPTCKILAVGAGAEFDKVITTARELNILGHNFFVWEALPKTEMPAILAASDMTLSVTRPVQEFEDNSANKFFDSLAAGRPIAINYGGWQAALLAEKDAGIQIPADDAQRAAHQIAAYLSDAERVVQAGHAARELAYERFHRDKMAAKLARVLEDVAAQ